MTDRLKIEWDERDPVSSIPGYFLKIHTGVTVGLQNVFTALRLPIAIEHVDPYYRELKHPGRISDPLDPTHTLLVFRDAVDIERDLANLQSEIQQLDRPVPDAVPEMVVYSRDTVAGRLWVVMVWGMVLAGKTATGTMTGDWYFVVCQLDELGDVLSQVFQIERWCKLEDDQPPAPSLAAKPHRAIDKKRAKIEQVLKEAGLRV